MPLGTDNPTFLGTDGRTHLNINVSILLGTDVPIIINKYGTWILGTDSPRLKYRKPYRS